MQSRSKHRSPLVAAVLSFILPGLGHIYGGRVRRGLFWALPEVAILALAAGLLVAEGAFGLAGFLFVNARPVAVVLLIMLVYRSLAMIDASVIVLRTAPAPSRRRPLAAGVVVVALLTGLNAVVLGYGAASALSADALREGLTDCRLVRRNHAPPPGCEIAGPREQPSAVSRPTIGPIGPAVEPTPEAARKPTAEPTSPPSPALVDGTAYWAENGRLDVLLIGGDAGPGRGGIRTDTMIVLSVDVDSARAALFGIPRNLYNVPLPDESKGAFPACGCFAGPEIPGGSSENLLNALYQYAINHPAHFPGGESAGFRAVSGAIEELLQVKLDGIAYVDLNGFIKIIDAIGGVTVNVPKPGITDARYPREDGKGTVKLRINPGTQKMDGTTALRFARSRHQDWDYARMERQQLVLTALRRELNVCSILPRIPMLLDATRGAFITDIPPDEFPGLLRLLGTVELGSLRRHFFHPPNGFDTHLDQATIKEIRDTVRNGFTTGDRVDKAERPKGSPETASIC